MRDSCKDGEEELRVGVEEFVDYFSIAIANERGMKTLLVYAIQSSSEPRTAWRRRTVMALNR